MTSPDPGSQMSRAGCTVIRESGIAWLIGQPCGRESVETFDGHPVCKMHARSIRLRAEGGTYYLRNAKPWRFSDD